MCVCVVMDQMRRWGLKYRRAEKTACEWMDSLSLTHKHTVLPGYVISIQLYFLKALTCGKINPEINAQIESVCCCPTILFPPHHNLTLLLEKDKLIIPGRIKRDSSFEANMHHLKLNGIRHNILLRERGGIMVSLYNHISCMRYLAQAAQSLQTRSYGCKKHSSFSVRNVC